MRLPRRPRREGATLLELCLAIGLTGTLLAAFLPRFVSEIRTSKVSEATTGLADLHRRTATYWAVDRPTGTRCLPPAAGPTPEEPRPEPVEVDFEAAEVEGRETWRALGFAPDRPLRYSYRFTPRAAGCGLGKRPGVDLVSFLAEGDLDGDGARSSFERLAGLGPEGDLVPVGVLYVNDRVE